MYTLLNERKIIRISGEERFKFLQGLITNDVNKLNSDEAIYACMLTPQGKYFADLFLKNDDDRILMDVPSLRLEEVLKKLNMYKLRSLISFKECAEYKVVSFNNVKIDGKLVFIDPRSDKLGLRGFIHEDEFKQITQDLENDQNGYDLLRINNFIADGEKDLVSGQSFPLEYGLDQLNAIDYKKGCYVGQELVARTHYTGVIRKQIVQVTSADKLPNHGALIYAGEQKIGMICSSVGNKGLALVRIEDFLNLAQDIEIIAEGQKIRLEIKENI